MKKNKVFRRMLKTALAVTLAGSMLVGCGGGGDGSQKSAEGTATAVSEREPGELRIGVVSTVDSIAPFVSFGDVLTQVRFYMWEYLGVPDENKELTPQIAKSWTTNDNGYTYEVEIYDYVTDSAGNAITANDVAFSYETYKACVRSSDLTNLESITVTGDYTLELKLTSNAIGVFDRVASGCPIVSQAAYESSGDEMAQDPIGTAAYIVSEFEPGASLTLTEREDYWQTDELRSPMSQTNLDKMTFKFINDASQCAIALETNDVDVSLFLPMTTVTQYMENPNYKINITNGSSIIMLMSGDSHSPLAENQALRQAVCYAIDNQGLVDACNGGYGNVMWDIASSNAVGYDTAWESEDYYNYDVEKAKEKLAEAGYGENEVTLSILVPSVGSYKRYAEVTQAYLMAAGINAEVNSVEPALYSSFLRDPSQYDLVITPDSYPYVSQAWLNRLGQEQNRGTTFNGFVDDELESLLQGCTKPDNSTAETINACHDYIVDQAYVYGLFMMPSAVVMRSDINPGELTYNAYSTQIHLSGCEFDV